MSKYQHLHQHLDHNAIQNFASHPLMLVSNKEQVYRKMATPRKSKTQNFELGCNIRTELGENLGV